MDQKKATLQLYTTLYNFKKAKEDLQLQSLTADQSERSQYLNSQSQREMEMDRPHPKKTCWQHHLPSPGMESSGKEKKKETCYPWRKTIDADLKRIWMSWGEAKRTVQDRDGKRSIVDVLCPNSGEED